MWSTTSESIRNGWYNSDRLSRSSRLAEPGVTAVDRIWFRRRSSHELKQIHKLIYCIFNVFWRPEYAQKYKLCVSASRWRVSLVKEDWADKCSLCFAGFSCKLALSLVNGIKRTQRGWKLKSCVEIKFKYGVWNSLSVVILQLHVNGVVQFASFCSFLPTFLIFFTGRL